MTRRTRSLWISATLMGITTATALVLGPGCGTGTELDEDSNPVPTSAGSNIGTGHLSYKCPNGRPNKQMQAQFSPPSKQQQYGGGDCNQNLVFKSESFASFQFNVDCENRTVFIQEQGKDSKDTQLPIDSDGRVRGEIRFLQQIQADGHGNQACWAEFVTQFDGRASCPTASLSMNTSVSFEQTNSDRLKQLGALGQEDTDPVIDASPSPSPSISVSPSPSESVSPSPSPTTSDGETESPLPSPIISPSVTPSHHPAPVATARTSATVICVIQQACPIQTSTDFKCDE